MGHSALVKCDHVYYNVKVSVVECQSTDTLDQYLINTLVDTRSTLDVGQESTTCVIFQADMPLNVKQYKQPFTSCRQSSAD